MNNVAIVARDNHENGIGTRADQLARSVKTKAGGYRSMRILVQYIMLCFNHYFADLDDMYVEFVGWVAGGAPTPVPVVGRPASEEARAEIQENLDNWRYAELMINPGRIQLHQGVTVCVRHKKE